MKFTAYFEQLLAQFPIRAYDVLSAQRGPDHEPKGGSMTTTSKSQIVARIRAITWELGPDETTWKLGPDGTAAPGIGLYNPVPLLPYEALTLEPQPLHYYTHLISAIRATIGHPLWSGQEETVIYACICNVM